MVEPPTPVRPMPARMIDPPDVSSAERDTGGGEVADPALKLEIAAGRLTLRCRYHGLDRDLVDRQARSGTGRTRNRPRGCCVYLSSPCATT